MLATADRAIAIGEPPLDLVERIRRALRPGVLGSLLLHALIVYLVVHGIDLSRTRDAPIAILPVELVRLADQTAAPAGAASAASALVGPRRAAPAKPRPKAPQVASLAPPGQPRPAEVSPAPERPFVDALEQQLQALAKLRLPDSGMPAIAGANETGTASGANGNGRGRVRTYSVKDLVRAQVERRWNLDLALVKGRNFTVPIRVRLRRDGTVLAAEIVDRDRTEIDQDYYSVALSARNAVLLSSPIALPAGRYDPVMEITLDLDPRDTVR